jgi:hypothetical protein
VTIAALAVGAIWWRTAADRHLAKSYRDTLAIAHGRYMRAAQLLSRGSVPAGLMFAYEGETPWILVIVRTGDISGLYAVRLVTRGGRPVPLGTMTVEHGQASWGVAISVPVDQIAAVSLTNPHAPPLTAPLG